MSDKRKLNRHNTGTVPKVKYTRNYTIESDGDNLRNLQNNLNSPSKKSDSNFLRNSPYNLGFESMDSLENTNNEVHDVSLSQASSSKNSSCGVIPKCDNVIKYPNKKQIEEKLNEIKEYLHITTSLMSSLKNTEEHQNFEFIGDSDNRKTYNQFPENQVNHEILGDVLQHKTLTDLKCKADRKLRDARHLQEKLADQTTWNRMENNFQEYDLAIAKVEESRKKSVMDGSDSADKGIINDFHHQEEERIINEIEELQSQIQVMHTANEDRNKLIQLLDKRDEELRSQHLDLQNKLIELQNRKSQVDQLVSALKSGPVEKEDEDSMGVHVQRIVSMKDQLSKLKDMLELVENTENLMQHGTREEQAIACEIFNKAENFLNKGNKQQHQLDNGPFKNLDKRSRKQVNNKNDRESDSKINEKLALQAELALKKRELEEIMGKHKASSSNLNHDFGNDNKSEFSCNSMFDNNVSDWVHNQHDASERYFSDNGIDEVNEFPEVLNPINDIVATNGADAVMKRAIQSERHNSTDHFPVETYERLCHRNLDGNGANVSFSPSSNMRQGKHNVQEQLEMIRSVRDSMLTQNNRQQSPSVQNLRNHLTPSPTYSELRTFAAIPDVQTEWMSSSDQPSFTADVANHPSWMTTNTLQAQAFMLTSLNQCYQMLWLQQRELDSLRAAVSSHSRILSNNNETETSSLAAAYSNQKVNTSTCSLPNLQAPAAIFTNSRILNNNNIDGRNINNESSENIWNGPALNNQVPPGNRANNYWDNFRSYSRQNLLSTKSKDSIVHNSPACGTMCTNNLRETDIRHQLAKKSHPELQSGMNTNVTASSNSNHINENVKEPDSSCANRRTQSSRRNSNVPTIGATDSRPRNMKSRNFEENSRSKLLEELKENIFKEVASLISANEARPHFLIQLFKDLRLVSSDPLRLKMLSNQSMMRSHQSVQESSPNQEIPSSSGSLNDFSMQSTVWSPIPPNAVPRNATILEGLISKKDSPPAIINTFHEIVPFLNGNEHLTINQHLLTVLKQKILESRSFRNQFKDAIFLRHFSNMLDDVLNVYIDKPLCSVKTCLLQSVRDLLKRELSFMNLIQNSGDCRNNDPNLTLANSNQETVVVAQIQNEDLAEADQSHVEDEDLEEEGAVGGILEQPTEMEVVNCPSESFVLSTEAESQYQLGLDRVPTRLPTITKSRSNTPNKDPNLKENEDQDHFN